MALPDPLVTASEPDCYCSTAGFGLLSIRRGVTASHRVDWLPATSESESFRNFFTALILTSVFALYEHRRVDSYGLPVHRAFSWQTSKEPLPESLWPPRLPSE